MLTNGTGPAQLRAEDVSALNTGGTAPGKITMEIVFDPPEHVRLPINDDEIIDRVLAIQSLAGRQVTLLTYDTSQSTRARAAGLPVIKLDRPLGEEPERNTRARKRRTDAGP